MAVLTYELYNTTPGWTSIGANTLVFSGSQTTIGSPISTSGWNDGTHAGNGDPGTDQCNALLGANAPNAGHANNVKYVDSTHFISNGGASTIINDTNLTQAKCTLRIHLNNATAVQTQNSWFFCFDGTTDTTEAVGVECYGFEQGVAASAWTQLNDDSATIGGDNSGERLDLGEKASAVDSYWYLAISARGESAGPKASFDFKIKTEIF